MTHLRLTLPLLLALSLVACNGKDDPAADDPGGGGGQTGNDAGADAGPDAGDDAGPTACDAGATPAGVTTFGGQVTFGPADGGMPVTPLGGTAVGTWRAVGGTVYLPRSAQGVVTGGAFSGRQWLQLGADGRYAQAVDLAATLTTPFGPQQRTVASAGYGTAQVVGAQLVLTQECGEAPGEVFFSNPSADGGAQVMLRTPAGQGLTGFIDVVLEVQAVK